MGNIVGIWNVSLDDSKDPVLKNLINCIKKKKLKYETTNMISGFFSDHSPFRIAGLKCAYSLTTVKNSDAEKLREFVKYPYLKKMFTFIFARSKLPILFRAYHNKFDNSSLIEEKTLRNVADVVYDAVIKLDKKSF